MPYIRQSNRHLIDEGRGGLQNFAQDMSAGDLNYAISQLVAGFIDGQGLQYEAINSAIGVLECAKLELYRRIAGPYEDKKMKENGDVYPEDIVTK